MWFPHNVTLVGRSHWEPKTFRLDSQTPSPNDCLDLLHFGGPVYHLAFGGVISVFEHIGGCPSIGTTLTTVTPACRVLIEHRPGRERERMLCETDSRAHHPNLGTLVGVWEVRREHIALALLKGSEAWETWVCTQ